MLPAKVLSDQRFNLGTFLGICAFESPPNIPIGKTKQNKQTKHFHIQSNDFSGKISGKVTETGQQREYLWAGTCQQSPKSYHVGTCGMIGHTL